MSGPGQSDAETNYLLRQARETREKLVRAEAEHANVLGLLDHVTRQRDETLLNHDGLLLQILENAPPCWDGDQSEESIALEYVRRLEAATAEGNIAMEDSRHRYECDGRCQL